MNTTASNRFIVCFATVGLLARPLAGAEKDPLLQVYLPRQITIQDASFTVGQVGIVRGEEPLLRKVNEVKLASFSMPGQQITIERPLLLSRLASAGIEPSQIRLTGAEETTVKRQQQVIKGSEFVELALSSLRKTLSPGLACSFNTVRMPEELVLPGTTRDIELSARMVDGGARNRPRIDIDVVADGSLIATRRIAFAASYKCRTVVALVDIPKGTVISAENVRIETASSDYPEPDMWSPPYGHIATRVIEANSVIGPHMTTSPQRQTVIKRNENVVVRIDMPGLLITAVGKALQDGKTGDSIRVRNADSRMIIWARVNEDGTLCPIY